ncbi:hypothetical protein [Natronomonas moolapensis]|nr:hypothetical protein [Natronomonas moolapensis]
MLNDNKLTESYDGSLTVRLLNNDEEKEDVRCSSYKEAIEVVMDNRYSTTVAKIIGKDGDVVFNSVDMDINDGETEWKHAKRRLSVKIEEYDCPHNSVACFADDLCVQCRMDKIQNQ